MNGLFAFSYAVLLFEIAMGFDYKIFPLTEGIINRCSAPDNNNYVDKVFDISKLKFSATEDSLEIDGNLVYTGGLEEKMEMAITIFKKLNGQWTQTILGMRRSDFCKSLFDKSEIWYNQTNQFLSQIKKCPPAPNVRNG